MNKNSIIQEMKNLVRQGFDDWKSLGNVNVKDYGGLLLFNYSPLAQYEGRWNDFEIASRGLIISKDGEVVARPFDKFFNYGERGIIPKGRIVSVSEKIDGSLGILYRHNGKYKIATRGSLDSEQALWATDYLKRYDLIGLPDEYTLLFEIIYPDNRVVVDYFGKEDLALIGVRNRFTGEYLSQRQRIALAHKYNFSLPTEYTFSDMATVLNKAKELSVNEEGFVVEFSSGERWKVKGEEYLKAHKFINSISLANVIKAEREGKTEELITTIPDEFLGEFKTLLKEVRAKVADIEHELKQIYRNAPKTNKKEFAIWVNSNHRQFASYLFAMWDNKSYQDLIYRSIA